ncbi:P-loop containing nucleoside triphosphate hydrolase protein [Lipomyces chichibuensis]|uniref:P-loop containing nucleoside triphosphate hydrolase protein n=1 Tax=Lipomyces chichibuensis TaxID=1546026 RepID=UPI0033441B20
MDTENLPPDGEFGATSLQSNIPIPMTPSVSRIPQAAFKPPQTVQLSPLSKRHCSSGGEVLGDLRPEITNMAPPKKHATSSVMHRSASTKSNLSSYNPTYTLNVARKPVLDHTSEKKILSSSRTTTAASRKQAMTAPATTTTTGKTSVRPMSASSIHRRTGSIGPPTTARPNSAQEDDIYGSGRILSVNTTVGNPPWDVKGRLENMELRFEELLTLMDSQKALSGSKIDDLQAKVVAYETERAGSDLQQRKLQDTANELQQRVRELNSDLEDEKRRSRIDREDLERSLKLKLDEQERLTRNNEYDLLRQHKSALELADAGYGRQLEERDAQFVEEINRIKSQNEDEKCQLLHQLKLAEADLKKEYENQQQSLQVDINRLQMAVDQERQTSQAVVAKLKEDLIIAQNQLRDIHAELEEEHHRSALLRKTIDEQAASSLSMESSSRTLQMRIQALEVELSNRDVKIAEMHQCLEQTLESEMKVREKLVKEETLRRILHNQVQELKGNIRVFCRVRPHHKHEVSDVADIKYPDGSIEGREIELTGPSNESALGMAMGTVTTKTHVFAFDKVFGPHSNNQKIFGEISQLVQSALDGYNVCIFCYGQTGSGKTYTMASEDGMITRAVDQIFTTATNLQEKGWAYTVQGQFLEIYNETINDLLVCADEFDKKKLEIRNDPKDGKIIVPDLTVISLDSQESVAKMLKTASGNRSVAATKANERSSRSHSVFILTLHGVNVTTQEKREGTLNLIDLAGSERLSHSQSTGERLKETVSINKSLSCLRDVITALGSAKDGNHIPYRNSKLTYLLQYSLGGNSKTLMFVNISPLKQHISETVNSLRFATKVNNTQIGTARRK